MVWFGWVSFEIKNLAFVGNIVWGKRHSFKMEYYNSIYDRKCRQFTSQYDSRVVNYDRWVVYKIGRWKSNRSPQRIQIIFLFLTFVRHKTQNGKLIINPVYKNIFNEKKKIFSNFHFFVWFESPYSQFLFLGQKLWLECGTSLTWRLT